MNNDLIVLAFDTALTNSYAITKEGQLLADRDLSGDKPANLLASLDKDLKNLGIEPCDLSFIALNTGPGSFTGIRMGIAYAKGMARALNLPVMALNSFEIIVSAEMLDSRMNIFVNASGGYFYYAPVEFMMNALEPVNVVLQKIVDENMMKEIIQEKGTNLFFGKKLEYLRDRINEDELRNSKWKTFPLAASTAWISLKRFRLNGGIDFRKLKPNYIKPSYVDI